MHWYLMGTTSNSDAASVQICNSGSCGQAVVNEDTTADAVALQRENERLRLQLEMYKELQKVSHTLC